MPIKVGGLNDHELHPQAGIWPTWLLPCPQRLAVRDQSLQYQGPLDLLAGPQRLEAGWLDGAPVLRDYFIARSPQAGLVWRLLQPLPIPQTLAFLLILAL